jgi:protease-4
MLDYVKKQINQAAQDNSVKAVVVRINSPGGSITASDDLHRRLTLLRDGDPQKNTNAKPLVASMASVAASGGYYVAVPAKTIFAERTTVTGSIGVYTSLPNVEKLATKYGVDFKVIKAGDIKDSGSMFKEMTPKEKQVWQDMVNDAYSQFLSVVTKNRPALTREKMLERFTVKPNQPDPLIKMDDKPYDRYRADGGIYSADKAKELKLIDAVGTMEDAITAAAKAGGLSKFRAVRYPRPKTLSELLFGVSSSANPAQSAGLLDPARIGPALAPRLWYLAPGYEGTAFFAGLK